MKMGLIGCPKTSVRNYHSVLHNVSEKLSYHLQFGDTGLGLAVHGPVQSNPVWWVWISASYANLS